MSETINLNSEKKLIEISKEISPLTCKIVDMEINSGESYSEAIDIRKILKNKINSIESSRKELVKPLNDHVKMINERFKNSIENIEKSIKIIDTKMLSYVEYERKRQEEIAKKEKEQEINRISAQIEIEKMKSEFLDEKQDEEHAINALILESKSKQLDRRDVSVDKPVIATSGNIGSISYRKKWCYEIIDEKIVPRCYLSVDDKLVKEAIKLGAREMPGIRIFSEDVLASR